MTKSDFAPKTGRDRGGSNHTGQHLQKSDEYHPSKSRVSEMYIDSIYILYKEDRKCIAKRKDKNLKIILIHKKKYSYFLISNTFKSLYTN